MKEPTLQEIVPTTETDEERRKRLAREFAISQGYNSTIYRDLIAPPKGSTLH